MLIEEFIERSNNAPDRETVFALYRQAIAEYGFDRVVYTLITDHKSCNLKAGHAIQSNYPDEWMAHYAEQQYEAIDPVTHYAFKTSQPFTWAELEGKSYFSKKQLNILKEATETGLYEGTGIPLYGCNGEIAGVGLASSANGINPDANMLCKLKALTEQFHFVYCQKNRSLQELEIPTLTHREVEVLKWLAKGKSVEDIATIMSCSASNIRFHTLNIYRKLGANHRTLAVVKAIHYGIITLDVVNPSVTD
jgi:DNA-binding CsgD family transcriptional regulator